MDSELSDAILMDAIGLAKSFKYKENLFNTDYSNFSFGDFINTQSYLTLQQMILAIENSESKFSNNYKYLQSLLKDIKLEKDRQNNFNNLIKAWAFEIDEQDQLLPEHDLMSQKEAKDASTSDNMRKELADLADTMKGRALNYKEILTRDNEKLHNTATIQQRELERLQAENQKSKVVENKKSISFFQLMLMIAASATSIFLCFIVMLLT